MNIASEDESVSTQFQAASVEINTIFQSFRLLYDIYSASFNNILGSLNRLPNEYEKQVKNAKIAFENASETVNSRQKDISNQLYAQGLVLMVGNAESLTREMFKVLLRNNVRKRQSGRKIELTLDQVLAADTDQKLGDLVLELLEVEKNPLEKLNFQNMKQLQGIMNGYFGIRIQDETIKDLHEFWQIRHAIIHNASFVDQRFIDNLNAADLPSRAYSVGQKILVKKQDYDRCFERFVALFDSIDGEIKRLNLAYVTG